MVLQCEALSQFHLAKTDKRAWLFALPARLPLFKEGYDAFLDVLRLATQLEAVARGLLVSFHGVLKACIHQLLSHLYC